jgi:uncharacterized protein YdhG (YjbR/CyaY superfamily)
MTDKPSSIDDYIAGFPPETQAVLEEMRAIIKRLAPEAVETISYAIPTFDLDGRHLIHFAGFTKHIGLYPTPAMKEFEGALTQYKTGKGSVQFPLGEALPVDLIERIVRFRLATVSADNSATKA